MSASVWAKRYKKQAAKRSAESSGTTISAIRREADRHRDERREKTLREEIHALRDDVIELRRRLAIAA